MARKTFDIAKLIHTVNIRNNRSTCDASVRQGWNSLLESVLHAADVYAGFNYLEQSQLRDSAQNSEPGIRFVRVFGDIPGPCDTVVEPSEFFEALTAENKDREARKLSGLHCPTGYARLFPDESRRFYYTDRKLDPKN